MGLSVCLRSVALLWAGGPIHDDLQAAPWTADRECSLEDLSELSEGARRAPNAVSDGLVAPTIKDVQKKGVNEIANNSKVLINKAMNGNLSPTDLEGGCITVSNLGGFGIDAFIPIVVPGQCSILGIGRITDTVVPMDGEISVRKLMSMILSVDHKVANGAYAAQFLDLVKNVLEDTSRFK